MIERQYVSDQRSFTKNAKTAAAGLLAFLFILFFMPLAVSAAGDIPTAAGVVQGTGIPMVNLTVFLLAILRVFFGLLGVIAVLLLIYGGFIWMTAGGDPGKVDKAKQIIYNTIIGLIIIFSAFAISSFLMSWLSGFGGGGGGGGTSNIPGGNGDWSRSAIGAGPIQSVYPAPNSVNVPINTRIAVTFKVNIKPDSICNPAELGDPNICDGDTMKNVEVCEVSATSSTCLAGSSFNKGVYASSTVNQVSAADQKTFVFNSAANLGNEDQINRTFMVTLQQGITAVATNKSVFDGLRVNYYNWAFKTNGVMDLTPPEVAKMEIYPNPDNVADAYAVGTQATTGFGSVTVSAVPALETPAKLNGAIFTGTALTGISATKDPASDPALPANYLKLSTAGFSVTGVASAVMKFTVSGAGDYITFDAAPSAAAILGVNFSNAGVCAGLANCLSVSNNKTVDLSGSGIIITSSGNFSDAKGSRWSFTVSAAINGDTVALLKSSSTVANFIFASTEIAGDQITKRSLADDGKSIVNTDYFTIKPQTGNVTTSLISVLNAKSGILITAAIDPANGNKINITPKVAGETGLSLKINSTSLSPANLDLSGAARVTNVTALPPGSKPDPYNNSVFRVSFTEAINPINIDSYIKIRINGIDVQASVSSTNQYRTVELTGTKPCGVNSCGKTIYCWLDPNTDLTASVPATTTITAASLKTCTGNDDWCNKFGGTCQAGGTCKLASGLNYPQATASVDGIVDMANNSFNGNFDKLANTKGALSGNAQGQSGTYNANDIRHFFAVSPNNFPTFTYANDNDTNGDNFSWSFFISTQIDLAAPLLSKIIPIGDYSLGSQGTESFRDPVRLVFNGLMRMATLKPGWGYGEDKTGKEWNTRYLILKTITSGANPVGYWVSSQNLDEGDMATGAGRGDGLADYTVADVNHNPFDQAINYGPLGGNGIESITQNCFLPGSGPINANADNPNGKCVYNADGSTQGCVTDASIPSINRVTTTNPSSYGYMNKCSDIDGAVACSSGKQCKVHYATSSATTAPNGSWIVTKTNFITNVNTGETGCCFGKCF
ncbi:MAG: hypothetical protein WCT26_00375 [Candidatus Buchananbacteria bacterium]|jgi:hypothetical protein